MDTLDGFFSDDESGDGAPSLRRVVENPRLPADGGLAILGLLMNTAGSVFALAGVTYTIMALLPGGMPITLALVAGLSAVRSTVHARVGRGLVEQGGKAVDGLGTYALVAGLHTALCLVLALVNLPGEPPLGLIAVGVAALMAWPLMLLALSKRGDVRRVAVAAAEGDDRIVGEDRGLTALGILMVVGGVMMGVTWVASAIALLLAGVLKLGFFAVLALVLSGLFATRAWFGLQVGRVAMTTRDPQRFMALFDRYNTIAVISVALTGVIITIFALFGGLQGLLAVVVALPMLVAGVAWPRAISHFATYNLPEVSFQDPLPAIRRPRDAGLTGLGAVLLAWSLPGLLIGLMLLVAGDSPIAASFGMGGRDELEMVAGSAVAFVTGWSLFNMTPRFQAVAVLYGVVAGGLGIWSVVSGWAELIEVLDFAGPSAVLLAVVQGVLALTLPGAVLWQALRHEEVGEDAVDADLAQAFD